MKNPLKNAENMISEELDLKIFPGHAPRPGPKKLSPLALGTLASSVVKVRLRHWVWHRLYTLSLKGHSHAILVHFKNQKYVLTSMNAHK